MNLTQVNGISHLSLSEFRCWLYKLLTQTSLINPTHFVFPFSLSLESTALRGIPLAMKVLTHLLLSFFMSAVVLCCRPHVPSTDTYSICTVKNTLTWNGCLYTKQTQAGIHLEFIQLVLCWWHFILSTLLFSIVYNCRHVTKYLDLGDICNVKAY